MHSEWEKGRRNLATGSINALQTTPTNEMLSFHFSRFCLSQSQGSRREREFCSLNLEFRDENEIFLSISQGLRRERDFFYQYLRVRDENEIFFSISQGSRRERDFFYQYLRVRDETEIFSFKSHVSRWDFETRLA